MKKIICVLRYMFLLVFSAVTLQAMNESRDESLVCIKFNDQIPTNISRSIIANIPKIVEEMSSVEIPKKSPCIALSVPYDAETINNLLDLIKESSVFDQPGQTSPLESFDTKIKDFSINELLNIYGLGVEFLGIAKRTFFQLRLARCIAEKAVNLSPDEKAGLVNNTPLIPKQKNNLKELFTIPVGEYKNFFLISPDDRLNAIPVSYEIAQLSKLMRDQINLSDESADTIEITFPRPVKPEAVEKCLKALNNIYRYIVTKSIDSLNEVDWEVAKGNIQDLVDVLNIFCLLQVPQVPENDVVTARGSFNDWFTEMCLRLKKKIIDQLVRPSDYEIVKNMFFCPEDRDYILNDDKIITKKIYWSQGVQQSFNLSDALQEKISQRNSSNSYFKKPFESMQQRLKQSMTDYTIKLLFGVAGMAVAIAAAYKFLSSRTGIVQ